MLSAIGMASVRSKASAPSDRPGNAGHERPVDLGPRFRLTKLAVAHGRHLPNEGADFGVSLVAFRGAHASRRVVSSSRRYHGESEVKVRQPLHSRDMRASKSGGPLTEE
jgi:hypothetical protein